jgi:hypothetical protein
VTDIHGRVEVRWLPGLGASCPGAVDLTMTGPLGPVTRAVTLPVALTVGLVIDRLCPGSSLHQTFTQVAEAPRERSRRGR